VVGAWVHNHLYLIVSKEVGDIILILESSAHDYLGEKGLIEFVLE
jgi:hypothetical protein